MHIPVGYRLSGTALLAALLLLVIAAPAARADDDPEALIREGVALRRKGDDARAHGYLKRAYDVSHSPRPAAQLGLVEEALGHYLDAQQHLSEALDGNDAWVDQNRAILEQSRLAVRQHLGKVELRGLPGSATVEIAGQRTAAPVPADQVVWVAPGSVTLTLAAADHESVKKDVTVSAGASVTLDIDLPSTAAVTAPETTAAPAVVQVSAPAAPTSPPEATGAGEKHALRTAGLITGGAGVVLGVAGLLLYLDGRSKLTSIENDAAAQKFYNESNGNYKTLGYTGDGLMIAGAVAVATGVSLFFIDRGPGEPATESHVSVGYASGVGGSIQIGGRF